MHLEWRGSFRWPTNWGRPTKAYLSQLPSSSLLKILFEFQMILLIEAGSTPTRLRRLCAVRLILHPNIVLCVHINRWLKGQVSALQPAAPLYGPAPMLLLYLLLYLLLDPLCGAVIIRATVCCITSRVVNRLASRIAQTPASYIKLEVTKWSRLESVGYFCIPLPSCSCIFFEGDSLSPSYY